MFLCFKIVRIAASTTERESFAFVCDWIVIVTIQCTATTAWERAGVRVNRARVICIISQLSSAQIQLTPARTTE